ncbi:phage tail assembly chaperone [Ponticaulis profundi]|uniref:Phage tail assembly chaperone n=1 Tax=Ponticaulis profundi TaxID=2665222 RepID=A0ABW1S4J2_9PROT
MKHDARTPWPLMLQAALRMGLSPQAFWQLSLREWQALTLKTKNTGFGRADLSALLSRFPDKD